MHLAKIEAQDLQRVAFILSLSLTLLPIFQLEFDDSFCEIIGIALFPALQKQRTEAVGGSSGDYGSVVVLGQTYSAVCSILSLPKSK